MKKMMIGLFVTGVVYALLPFVPLVTAADYPTKPIQLLVGYAAGGSTDSFARAAADSMQQSLGQPVVVINKPGGGGGVLAVALKGAKPDGYTFGATTAITLTFNPIAQKVDYAVDDFRAVGAIALFQEAFVSAPDKPWKDFKGLVEYAKKHPGLTYASQVLIDQAITRIVAKKEGIQWKAVPTKGGEEVVTALLGKHVDFGFSGGVHPPFVKAGKLIVLANPGDKRLLGSPNVPTMKELGYDVSFVNHLVLLVPKATPDDIVKKLTEAAAKATKEPRYIQLVEKQYVMPADFVPGDRMEKILREQLELNRNLLQEK